MKPKVFIARPIPAEAEAYIARHCEVKKWEGPGAIPRDRLLEAVADVEGLLTSGHRIDAELLDSAPKLRVVCNAIVGYNNFDLEAMRKRRILGTHTPTVLDDTVADLVMGLMLAAARRITELDAYVKAGNWKKGDVEVLYGIDVHHKTLGIIGMGRIGEAIAKRAYNGFGMKVLYHNRSRKPEAEKQYAAEYAAMEELLRQSDFVVLMTPLTPETDGLMGENEFRMMKSSAIFINASRGKTVNEQALIKALKEGWIHAAGLDVFEQEPVDLNNPLLRMSNVVTLPHIGSATAQTRFDMVMLAAQNLVQTLQGQEPPNVVPELRDLL
ncbi:2-hydroxyacid dehydrogenase [Ferviditalea candida]|uniref:D-glycerate dehydrogenase n=1 Tax=Ferviditalea candida TaxID=3108399 RepID=A0ABU5ZGL0_9BACL|nr:D-glycerate dehydrogenase [Paenibacillaceae bacterium T2]